MIISSNDLDDPEVIVTVEMTVVYGDIPPDTPEIIFAMDLENNTLTVVYVNPDDVLWSDLDQIGSGTCDPLPTGNVTVGDMITNCSGTIVLRYIPTNEVIGVFEFQ